MCAINQILKRIFEYGPSAELVSSRSTSACRRKTALGTACFQLRVPDAELALKPNDHGLVRRLLALVMLVMFASLNAIDGVCCPDGCTDEQQSSSERHTPDAGGGTCALCLGGVDSSTRQHFLPCGVVTDGLEPPPPEHHLDALPDPLDHPPRT